MGIDNYEIFLQYVPNTREKETCDDHLNIYNQDMDNQYDFY
jgi:hypothetical protein